MMGLRDQLERKVPEPFGVDGVQGVRGDAADAGAATLDHLGLVAVLELASADALQLR